jgi:hypothetical protein
VKLEVCFSSRIAQSLFASSQSLLDILLVKDYRLKRSIAQHKQNTTVNMRASIFVSAIAFAVASAQDSSPSSSIDPAPQTTYHTQTNSLGVVTGMPEADTSIASQPDAATSQPAVVTTQPVPADIPAVGPGVHTLTLAGTGTGSMVNSTRTVTVSANNSTTVALVASPTSSDADATGSGASGSGADATGSDASATGSGAGADATGAAVNVKAAAGSIVGFGAFMAAFL